MNKQIGNNDDSFLNTPNFECYMDSNVPSSIYFTECTTAEI